MNAPIPSRVLNQHLIDPEICIRCNTCEETCPIDAITHDANNYVVDPGICNHCMACVPPCPTGAIDNWLKVLSDQAYSMQDQFGWDVLPAAQDIPDGMAGGETPADPQAEEAVQADALDEISPLEGMPSTAAGSSIPPWSAAHPYVNLYTHKNPVTATVVGNYRVTGDDTESDIRHIVLDFGTTSFPVLEGQSIAIFPPGTDGAGRPHHARQYSIASPRDGERPRYNNLSLTVKRVTTDYDGKDAAGVCSNYLCDLKKNDTVKIIGPFGNTFLMPNQADANIIMICTGTGSAPMRAMTERCRRLLKEDAFKGRLMLFFGARTERELPYFGPLMNLPKDFIDINLALSREQGRPKRYVQDLIRERAADVLPLLESESTCIYVCGLKGMEDGVLQALEAVVSDAGRPWAELHAQLKSQGRLHFETY
ncbi:benzoyl-CoA 2,3-epoxidase subunit BoxA [Pollutimonas sp. M17]|uniref:benzoyl-CoA 2,3-epoxidase subunit BoxA n=1 Tax=Pollutimonas sp. M17 TaxID=2962065 RepID=UPI0021F48775|nr:benzoyl-CoA 2,3-epoxidase subunit BoxA [Pollutimonas sp. M17]UYO92922.1 benzoyl-CoA 2,3-epoxidase subunit BoxA [Pollutimonas sp. M17]